MKAIFESRHNKWVLILFCGLPYVLAIMLIFSIQLDSRKIGFSIEEMIFLLSMVLGAFILTIVMYRKGTLIFSVSASGITYNTSAGFFLRRKVFLSWDLVSEVSEVVGTKTVWLSVTVHESSKKLVKPCWGGVRLNGRKVVFSPQAGNNAPNSGWLVLIKNEVHAAEKLCV